MVRLGVHIHTDIYNLLCTNIYIYCIISYYILHIYIYIYILCIYIYRYIYIYISIYIYIYIDIYIYMYLLIEHILYHRY